MTYEEPPFGGLATVFKAPPVAAPTKASRGPATTSTQCDAAGAGLVQRLGIARGSGEIGLDGRVVHGGIQIGQVPDRQAAIPGGGDSLGAAYGRAGGHGRGPLNNGHHVI